MTPRRPANVPEAAIWDADDSCFRAGEVDAQGRKHGVWTAWFPSGSLYGEDRFEAGLEQGASWCARSAMGETPFDHTFDPRIHRLERVHDRGMLMSERCLTRDGSLVGSDGEPWPARGADIPEGACYLPASELWVHGPIDAGAPITGRQRLWYRDGQLLADAEWVDGERHGKSRTYNHAGLTIETELAGPPLTHLIDADYERGALRQVTFLARDGGEALVTAQLDAGKLHGALVWAVHRHMNFHEPVFRSGTLVVTPRELLGERRLGGIARIEASYDQGALVSTRAFDRAGDEIVPPPAVGDFGQDMTRDRIAGYIARGDLARDVAAWFPHAGVAAGDDDAARAQEVFARLPEGHRDAAAALDALVRAGKFPRLVTCNLDAYGFDCVKNDLYGAAEDRYFGLAYDESGNMQLLDVDTGGVVGYEHEEGIFDAERAFASLDEWAFCMVRVELAFDRRVPADELRALFERVGVTGGARELSFA